MQEEKPKPGQDEEPEPLTPPGGEPPKPPKPPKPDAEPQ